MAVYKSTQWRAGFTCVFTSATRAAEAFPEGIDLGIWRRRPDLNRGWRFCRPLPYHLATAPDEICEGRNSGSRDLRPTSYKARGAEWAMGPHGAERAERGEGPPREILERETGFEPATSTLARSHSTTELFPLDPLKYHTAALRFQ